MKKRAVSDIRLILCNWILVALLFSLVGCSNESAAFVMQDQDLTDAEETRGEETEDSAEDEISPCFVEISFDFNRMATHASNQIAIWIEDEDGKTVKTVFVTDFTAARRGYRNRSMALLEWVDSVEPDTMTDEQMDAISEATPTDGHLKYYWDLTDDHGNRVAKGIYKICVEGTLLWESSILFSAFVDTTASKSEELSVDTVRSEPNNHENEDMIRNMRIFAAVS